MRIAAVYDVHGNLPALEAVLDDVRRESVDLIVVGGDVLPGPMPSESLSCLLDAGIPLRCIKGNGDREALALAAGMSSTIPAAFRVTVQWSGEQMSRNHAQLMESWPATTRLVVPALGRVLFCHATPRNDTDVFTRLTAEEKLRPIFAHVDVDVVVCGHTHMQFDRMVGGTRIVNAGSVGMSFAGAGAHWLLLGPDLQARRTGYDLERAAARIRATQYPGADDFATRYVLNAPTEEETLKAFSGIELGAS